MDERTVYCKVWRSNRRIKFVKTVETPDVDQISSKLVNAAEKDAVLGKMILGKAFVLQMNDKNGVLCDIDPDDDVKDGTKINVEIFDTLPSPSLPDDSDSQNSLAALPPPSVGFKMEFMNKKSIHKKISFLIIKVFNIISIKTFARTFFQMITQDESAQPNNFDMIAEACNEDLIFEDQVGEQLDSTSPNCSSVSCAPVGGNVIATKSQQFTFESKCRISPQYKLPELPDNLREILESGRLFKNDCPFIRFFYEDLRARTNGRPSRPEYQNYAEAIVREYPRFGNGVNKKECVSLKKQLRLRKKFC